VTPEKLDELERLAASTNGVKLVHRRDLLDLIAAARREAALREATDGLSPLLSEILRKYGGTMKGRGDHDIFDGLVRYRARSPRCRNDAAHEGWARLR